LEGRCCRPSWACTRKGLFIATSSQATSACQPMVEPRWLILGYRFGGGGGLVKEPHVMMSVQSIIQIVTPHPVW
jgi:hypothetical protein